MTDDETRRRGFRILREALKIAAWFVGTAGLAGVAWFMTSRPAPVRTVRPERGEVVVEVFGTGTLESKVVVGVSSKIVGKVVDVLVDQGDTVTAGQTLARLEAKDFNRSADLSHRSIAPVGDGTGGRASDGALRLTCCSSSRRPA